MLVDMSFLFGLFVAEMGIYLAYKVARGDFYSWIPIDGPAGFVISLLMRVFVKVLADFTAVVQLRGPAEMGGLYFTVNSFAGFAFSFAAIKVFFASVAGKESRLNEDFVVKSFLGLFGFWILTTALGFRIIKKEYWGTFVSFKTGNYHSQRFFLEGKTDEVKSDIITVNRMKWKPIRADVKKWVLNNWLTWKEEKPGWFTDAWIAKVPDDFIPIEEDRFKLLKLRLRHTVLGGNAGGGKKKKMLRLREGGAAAIVPVTGTAKGST
jgi:hypothetical protein